VTTQDLKARKNRLKEESREDKKEVIKIKKIYGINKNMPNAAPPESRFFGEMSKKRQRCAVVNLENNFSISAKFTDVYCFCKQQLSRNKW
jgi:hypothetical protein